jgi:Na+/proline symporter
VGRVQHGLLIGIVIYLIAHLAVGAHVARRVKTEQDYLLAGRRLGPTLSAFTIFATWFGAETCLGAAGLAYRSGLAGTGSEPFGYALCLVLMATLFAIPLWRRGLTTLADLFRERYGAGVERCAILLMVPTSVLWAAAQIRAFGLVFALASGLSTGVGVTVAAVCVLIYTSFGGLWADALNDIVQGIVLTLGLIITLIVVVFFAEPQAWAAIPPERLSLSGAASSPLAFAELFAVPVLGSVMAQELVQRVSAARSPEIARRSTLIAAAGYLTVGLIPVVLGLVAADLVPDVADPEQVLLALSQRYLPFWLQLLLTCALISAMLSTVDSALLVAGSLLAHNLAFSGRQVSERARLLGNRLAVVLVGAVAYVLALVNHSVHEMVQEASSFGSAGVLVIGVFGLFGRFGGAPAALAALGGGLATYISGAHLFDLEAPFLASLLAALVGYVGVALLTRGAEDPQPSAAEDEGDGEPATQASR